MLRMPPCISSIISFDRLRQRAMFDSRTHVQKTFATATGPWTVSVCLLLFDQLKLLLSYQTKSFPVPDVHGPLNFPPVLSLSTTILLLVCQQDVSVSTLRDVDLFNETCVLCWLRGRCRKLSSRHKRPTFTDRVEPEIPKSGRGTI